MKKYQKAELIAKNLPTGSYAAGCPMGHQIHGGTYYYDENDRFVGSAPLQGCKACEVAG